MLLQREILQSVRMDPFEPDHKLPEVRLWAAIVLVTVEEYEEWLKRIQSAWLMHGQPVRWEYAWTLRRLRYEINHQWFRSICDHANTEHSAVRKRILELEAKYGLHNVRFAEQPPAIPKKTKSDYDRRRRFRRNRGQRTDA